MGLSESLLLDYLQESAGVCTILPGNVDTELMDKPGGGNWKLHPDIVAQAVVTVSPASKRRSWF